MTQLLYLLAFGAVCFLSAWAYVALDNRRRRKAWDAEVRRMEREARLDAQLEERPR